MPDHVQLWNVRPTNFPFGAPGAVVGVVRASDRADAERKTRDLYGRGYVVGRRTATPGGLHPLGDSGESAGAR